MGRSACPDRSAKLGEFIFMSSQTVDSAEREVFGLLTERNVHAANAGLRRASVAVIPGRESAGMLVGPVSNAGHYIQRV
jgi:hypothetical protein